MCKFGVEATFFFFLLVLSSLPSFTSRRLMMGLDGERSQCYFNKSLASCILMPSSVKPSFTLSIHHFLCLPLLLLPSTIMYKSLTTSLPVFIRFTCPNHCSFHSRSFSTSVLLWFSFIQMFSFLCLSILLIPAIRRSQFISADKILRSSHLFKEAALV